MGLPGEIMLILVTLVIFGSFSGMGLPGESRHGDQDDSGREKGSVE